MTMLNQIFCIANISNKPIKAHKSSQILTNPQIDILLKNKQLKKYFYTSTNQAIFQGLKIRHCLQSER